MGQAYRYLGLRDRTVAEVRRHLQRRAVAEILVERCLSALHHQGYLDDVRFVERFTEDRRALDSWGSERIRTRLRALGIEEALCEPVTTARDRDEEMQAAVELLRRRLGGISARDDRARQRALGLLLRRGYELELAHDAIRCFARGS